MEADSDGTSATLNPADAWTSEGPFRTVLRLFPANRMGVWARIEEELGIDERTERDMLIS